MVVFGVGSAFVFVINSLLVVGVYVAVCVPRFLNVTVTGGPATAGFMCSAVNAKKAIKEVYIFIGVAPCGVMNIPLVSITNTHCGLDFFHADAALAFK